MPLAPRPLPPETIDGLRPPPADFPYFAQGDKYPFEAAATDYSATNAWWLSDASLLIYGEEEFIDQALRNSPLAAQEFELGWLGTPSDNRGMALSNQSALIVIFRGTRLQKHDVLDKAEVVLINQDDLWTDSQFLPAAAEVGGRVHSGFLSAFAEISDNLDAMVQARRPGQALWLAGHSLGGALATLAAAHVGLESVQGLYTYGSPRVGDAAFAATLPARSHYRFVHGDDWVPTVPPEFLGYVHAGTVRWVTGRPARRFWDDLASGTEAFASALSIMAREQKLTVGQLPIKISGLVDHAPVYYATLLWNALVSGSAFPEPSTG